MSPIRLRMLWLSAAAATLIATDVAAQGTSAAAPTAPAAATSTSAPRTPAPKDVYLYIGWPLDGATVPQKFKVWFGLRNFGVAPAGVDKPNTGHHHLLIDAPVPPLDQPIPNDHNHLHFGLGQTEAIVELPPGKHTLQLLMGDANHVPHNPPIMSKRITIYVRAERGAPAAQ